MSEEEDRRKHLEEIDKILADKLAPAKTAVPEEEKRTREEVPEIEAATRERSSADERPCDACGLTFKRNVQNTSILGYPVCPHCGNNPDNWDKGYTIKYPRFHKIFVRVFITIIFGFGVIMVILGLLGKIQ
ncbi:MAG: hypothetical protein P8M70_13870 [Verrucomicrobiota bacterium]|nr:hypothetical protein [Verrucomicrobiota bacterium]